MIIRFGLKEDVDAILMHSAEAVLSGVWAPISEFDIDSARRNVQACVDAGLTFVAEHEGEVVGFVLHRELSWLFSDKMKYFETVHFYVLPSARRLRDDRLNLRTSDALLQASKDLANASGMDVYAPMMWGPRIESRDRFMRKAGFKSVGGTFVFAPEKKAETLQAAE
ncbi:MAG TPA: GNAT family N-acetyltransferase [Hyphomicrobium sp.]|nr:GNAT family N-acetyltransferase [Hyphomicrobium sp.]